MKSPTFTLRSLMAMVICSAGATSMSALDWREDFSTQAAFDAFTVIDANNDGTFWEWISYNKLARISYSDYTMDDWLITPAFQLNPGVYKFSLDAKNYMGAEKFEVFAGQAPSAEGMTLSVIPETTVSTGNWSNFSGEFTVPEGGTWYIGIHGCSAPDKLYLDIDNLTLTQGVSQGSPLAVSDLQVIPDPSGLNSVTINCTLPAQSTAGSALTSLDKVEILQDNIVIKTETGTPGAEFSVVINNATLGRHKYTVVAYANGERGAEVSAEVFVGPNVPAQVASLAVGEFSPGQVTVRWTAPSTDVDGQPINPDLIKYKVVRYEVLEGSMFYEEDIEGADNLSGYEYVHNAIDPNDGQMFTAYGVYAITSAGKSTPAKTPLFPVGTNYQAPFEESFPQGESTSLFRTETVNYYQVTPMWVPIKDENSDIKSVDKDGGYIAMMGEHTADCARYYSGKVDISDLQAPALTFYVYNAYNGHNQADRNKVEVYVSDGSRFYLQKEFQIKDLPSEGWNRISISLDDFKGKTIQFAFMVTIDNYMATRLDAINISEGSACDMALIGLEVPERIAAGMPFDIGVKVENQGIESVSGYEVELYVDGQLNQSMVWETVEPGETEIAWFTYAIEVLNIKDVTISARVVAPGDADNTNDSSADYHIEVYAPNWPVPTDLAGNASDNGVALTWARPETSAAVPEQITEDFESFDSFAIEEANGWIFLDVDGHPVGKLTDIVFPNVTIPDQGAGFWVMDSSMEGLNELFAARSGSKYLAQMFNADKFACDDWAISPELFGGAQTVGFYAKSYSTYFSERFEFLYSEGGLEPTDFHLIAAVNAVPNQWTRYEYDVPEGAKRFAIRCTSEDCYLLFIDDVTYTPVAGDTNLELMGYNIYRDLAKVNEAPVETESYVDSTAPGGEHSYLVTAVYDRGESMPSEEISLTVAGIGQLSSADSHVIVKGLKGELLIETSAPTSYIIATTSGQVVANGYVESSERLSLPQGLYLVTIANRTLKAIVK